MDISERITFLVEKFDVFESDTDEMVINKISGLVNDGNEVTRLTNMKGDLLALLIQKETGGKYKSINTSLCLNVFSEMISADPTENKIYLEWMLDVFNRLVVQDVIKQTKKAIMFISEDLPQANAYLMLFDGNKRKKKFHMLCKGNKTLQHISDPSNINQYRTLSELFDAVDPFIKREPSAVERTMEKYVEINQGVIAVKDRKFTVFIPKTTEANVVFGGFANWCTAREDNGMFKSYTETNKKPNGKNSDIYIIINNKFFTGESDEIYQMHFETRQLKDRKNDENKNIYESVICQSEAIKDYFHDELMIMAKEHNKGIKNNVYLDFLIEFGFTEALFDIYSKETEAIKIMDRNVVKMPDLSSFKNMLHLTITNAKLSNVHESIGNLSNLEILTLRNNNIKALPKEIGALKNLKMLNIKENKITNIPNEIAYLDRSNGGSLVTLCVEEEDIGSENYEKLKRLLPETSIV